MDYFRLEKIILASLAAGFGTSAITANAICQTAASIQVIPGSAMQLAATTVIARCIGAAYLFARTLGIGALGIWLAMVCDWLFRAVVFSIRWLSGKWKAYRVV